MKDASDLETTSVVRITQAAQLYSSSVFSAHTHQSLPIPVLAEKELFIGFLYSHAEIVEPGEGLKLWAPSYIAYVEANTCEFHQLAAVNPGSFGFSDPTDSPIGSYFAPAEQQGKKYLTGKVRLMQAYDLVLTSYLRAIDRDKPEIVEQRQEFCELFSELSETCLHSYYLAVGKNFFTWVGMHFGKP